MYEWLQRLYIIFVILHSLLRLRSAGILQYLEAKWSFHQDQQHGVFNNYQQVELGHIQILVIGLLIMMIVSVIICVFENVWFNLHNKTKHPSCSVQSKKNLMYKSTRKTSITKQHCLKCKRWQKGIFKRNISKCNIHVSLYR